MQYKRRIRGVAILFVDALAICKDEQNISLVLLFLLAAQSQTKMYHFLGVPFLRISALFFAEKKGDVPTLYSPNRKAQKREEAGLSLLPLQKAYFRLNYLPK